MQEDTSFRGDVIGLCISIKGRHTEGKGRHQRGLSSSLYNYSPFSRLAIHTTFLKPCYLTRLLYIRERKYVHGRHPKNAAKYLTDHMRLVYTASFHLSGWE